MISNDPGKPETGAVWAQFYEPTRTLVGCGVWGLSAPVRGKGERVVIEKPMIYPRSPVPPNDIATLSVRAGRIAQALCGWDEEPIWVPAGTWKGTINPDLLIDRVLGFLTPNERRIYDDACKKLAKGYWHNLGDGIGLGLYDSRRMGRGGT